MENRRLQEARENIRPWKKWGPYLSERQWGTVREDYSYDGNAWDFFPHDHARSRAYRWGEDGIAGISDDQQHLCFAVALWNGKDAILKERLFGLTNREGNHGEDVKEYYFYLDNTPSHSYMKYLYKYPQVAYPYEELVRVNGQRSAHEMEYELLDTGVFHENRYFDVFIEYAKNGPEDILIKISALNHGPEMADLHILPALWFRNDWSAWIADANRAASKPLLQQVAAPQGHSAVVAQHSTLGDFVLFCEGDVPVLFTENETNHELLFPGTPNESAYVKDGINNAVIHGLQHAVNPERKGTKASPHYQVSIGSGQTSTIRLRLTKKSEQQYGHAFDESFESIFNDRIREANEFYQSVIPTSISEDEKNVMRQALAGMLWSKQFFFFDGDSWLEEHNTNPLHKGYRNGRNSEWYHMLNKDIISMPDKWEYPWYAAWDLAFHTLPLSIVDPDFAKGQMQLMLRGSYMHPNGQMPAYEWNFSDVNPPVHAWASLFLHRLDTGNNGRMDLEFLRSVFNQLLVNFTWWVNRKDRSGKNLFEGGFLGLDNISIFDRSSALPTGGYLEQADGTAWMALFSQNMFDMACELSVEDPSYEEMIAKFTQHFQYIAFAMNGRGDESMWDEEDGFYYDLLRSPDGSCTKLKVRSLVGLLPLCATSVIEKDIRERLSDLAGMFRDAQRRMPELMDAMHPTGKDNLGVHERGIYALVDKHKLKRILARMLDENEFLGPFGIRSVSKFHEKNPFVMHVNGKGFRVSYLPAESDSTMFGGNSNWRGPVWMPVNLLILRALQQFYLYYGDSFKVEFPTGSGVEMNLFEVSKQICNRIISIYTKNKLGKRPVFGGAEKFHLDPNWSDYILFYEYYHGDNGAGLGASHQTGWSGAIAKLIEMYGLVNAESFLEGGVKSAFKRNI